MGQKIMTKFTAELDSPDDQPMTVTLTMTVAEWKKVAAALKPEDWWPCGRLASAVSDSLRKIFAQVSERIDITP